MRQSVSLREPGNFWKSLWKSPDQFLIEAGAAGEMLVARIRLLLTSILLLIPLISLWYEAGDLGEFGRAGGNAHCLF